MKWNGGDVAAVTDNKEGESHGERRREREIEKDLLFVGKHGVEYIIFGK